jgi:hypothetical protein
MDTTSLIKIPGYNYCEYLLILNPHEDLRNRVMQIKKEFSIKYRVPEAIYSMPNIPLVNFIRFEMKEGPLLNYLKRIAAGHHSFKVDLKDYGSFPSHTIFINVESKQQVQDLVKELKKAQQFMKADSLHKPHFMDNFFVLIARKLLPWQYEKGWLEYNHCHFMGCFIANGMRLLKRPLMFKPDGSIMKGKYKIIQKFEFMNLPVKTKQGDLFIQ